ncbi:unnamed protein product [Linum tenue]|uniref:DUF1421 domain-containing protein n=1 Tax=Linum tenue TaxID=586396 RepID=A0AAV0NRK5_9ROSI|nr:unnamed protein product [Linum tenue]CAI0461009.1 unnamed protein product [Linum tenue]
MASGSSGRPSSGSKGFDFGSDDILCSYDDFANQESSNGTHSDPIPASNPSKGFEKSRLSRSSGYQAASYGHSDDSFLQDVISAVDKSMKRHSENQMRFLEGISSRLSQLELYCYNLDKSIGEMRSDLTRDHSETDTKLKAVEKHLQEVHRSVQILRDKQELAETQKELAKLQLVQKESSSSTHSQSPEERKTSSPPASDPKTNDNTCESHNQQLALALPQQHQQISAPPPSQSPQQAVAQQQPQTYYLPTGQPSQSPYMPPDSQYRSNQMQGMPSQPAPAQVNQGPPQPSQQQYHPQYQQQWPQQATPMQHPQVRPLSSNAVYPPYPHSQSSTAAVAAAPQQETMSSSMAMPSSYSTVPQPYGYGGTTRPVPQQQLQQPQQIKVPFVGQACDGFTTTGPLGALPPGSAYMVYEGDGGRAHFSQGGYHPPPNLPLQSSQQPGGAAAAPNMMPRNPGQGHFIRNHPYNELIEKLVNMGFRGDHVMGVIQRMEETGQPVDFNAVLDRLSVHSSGSSQRVWSG